ncbi:MAG TPA: hydroxymethylbilane synthase [Conexibacter sp.]|nr:hydroxymethylbilane synthase [Conexibacter sp.]
MRVGTRGSALALAQASHVARLLGDGAEVVPIATSGDRGELPGDKSRWVKELELALLADEIDVAVHSAKDVPAELPDGLALVGVPERVDARDALCGAPSLAALAAGARVGTSSLRRAAELRAVRPDLDVVALRGNVDTRLRKLEDGACDAIVLALAGLLRLGRADAAGGVLDELVPAPGQGTLLLEARADDRRVREAAAALEDPHAAACLAAERALVRTLGATCHTPLGAHAALAADGALTLRAFLGLPDGSAWLRDELSDPLGAQPEWLGAQVGERMRAAGADELLCAVEAAGAGAPPPASTPEGTRV